MCYLVAIYSWVTPPFEGPDEPQHFAYIEWLVEHNDFPPQGEAVLGYAGATGIQPAATLLSIGFHPGPLERN